MRMTIQTRVGYTMVIECTFETTLHVVPRHNSETQQLDLSHDELTEVRMKLASYCDSLQLRGIKLVVEIS